MTNLDKTTVSWLLIWLPPCSIWKHYVCFCASLLKKKKSQTELSNTDEVKKCRQADNIMLNCSGFCQNIDLSYNSRQYQPSEGNASFLSPSLHYRKLKKQVNIPFMQHTTEPLYYTSYENKTEGKHEYLRHRPIKIEDSEKKTSCLAR